MADLAPDSPAPPLWRLLLIEIPALIIDIGMTWYRLYITVMLFLAGPVLLLTVLTLLVLRVAFGVQWGL